MIMRTVVVYFIFRLQGVLPLNPAHIEGMEPTLAFNTAISIKAITSANVVAGAANIKNVIPINCDK
jgi:K+-transporting ATPase ATPase A chain